MMIANQPILVTRFVCSKCHFKNKKHFSILQDGNGTIENEELKGFLKDLLELVKKVFKH